MTSSLTQTFIRTSEDFAHRSAIIDDHETVSYGELKRRAEKLARVLRSEGLGGQRVALLSRQGAVWLEGFFGILLAGATAVPLSHLHPAKERQWFIRALAGQSRGRQRRHGRLSQRC